jgi:hypothetical protein
MSRFLPAASTTRWIVGVSSDVAQFSGTGNRGLQGIERGRTEFGGGIQHGFEIGIEHGLGSFVIVDLFGL